MPAPTIDQSFVDQFESDVHLDYQRTGAKLLNTFRRKVNVKGQSTTFQKIGKGTAGQKSRHGQVPLNNLSHAPIKCTLADYYSGEYVDNLDELKIEHDERAAVSTSLASAMGRKSDDLGVKELDGASNTWAGAVPTAFGKAQIFEIFEFFGNNDVPDDGKRCLVVNPYCWDLMLTNNEFASSDYVSDTPWEGMTAKRWHSFFVMTFTGLTKTGDNTNNLAYHQSAIGHASGQEVQMDMTWQGKEQAWLFVASMSQGAKRIDENGIFKAVIDETP